jgi:parallel beta-helix repeat protein
MTKPSIPFFDPPPEDDEADERAISAAIGTVLLVAITATVMTLLAAYVLGYIPGGPVHESDDVLISENESNVLIQLDSQADYGWVDVEYQLPNGTVIAEGRLNDHGDRLVFDRSLDGQLVFIGTNDRGDQRLIRTKPIVGNGNAPVSLTADVTVDPSDGSTPDTIQDGINAAAPGETVYVKPGTYDEQPVVNKDVEVVADGGVTVAPTSPGACGAYGLTCVIHVQNDDVTLDGFTFRGDGSTDVGVLSDASRTTVRDTTIDGIDTYGVAFYDPNEQEQGGIVENVDFDHTIPTGGSYDYTHAVFSNHQNTRVTGGQYDGTVQSLVRFDTLSGYRADGSEVRGVTDLDLDGTAVELRSGVDNVVLDQLNINHVGNHIGVDAEGAGAFILRDSTFEDGEFGVSVYDSVGHSEVRDTTFTALSSRAIKVSRNDAPVTVDNTQISSSGSYPIHITSSVSGLITVSDNTISDGGVHLMESSRFSITGNNINDVSTGVRVWNTPMISTTNSQVINNVVSDAGWDALHIWDEDVEVRGNTLTNGERGIYLGYAKNALVVDNTVQTMEFTGIETGLGSEGLVVRENTVDNVYGDGSATGGAGLRLGTNDVLVEDNVVRNSEHGIALYNTTMTIRDNEFRDNTEYAVALRESDGYAPVTFRHNVVVGSAPLVGSDGSADTALDARENYWGGDDLDASEVVGPAGMSVIDASDYCLDEACTSFTSPADHIVAQDGSGDYTTIQDAVTASSDGETIEVKSGTYNEEVFVGRSVTLVTNEGAVIDGGANNDAVKFSGSETVTLDGFTIRGGSDGYGLDGYGTGNAVTLKNLQLESTGITLRDSSGAHTIENVTVDGGFINLALAAGDWSVTDSRIDGSAYDGIIARDTTGSWTVSNTELLNSNDWGINAIGASITGDATSGNTFSGNADGQCTGNVNC